MNRPALMILVALAFVANGAAQELGMEIGVSPVISLPLGSSNTNFNIGAGGVLRAGAHFGSLPVFAGGSAGYSFHTTPADTALHLVALQAGGGLALRPGALDIQLGLQAGGFLGLYRGVDETLTEFNPMASARGSVGVILGGGLKLELGAEYSFYFTRSDGQVAALYQGIDGFVGVSLRPGMSSGPREPRIRIQPPEFDRVFPVFYSHYESNPLGTIVIENGESGPIQNVQVELLVDDYMNAPKASPVLAEMQAGEAIEVPLFGLFNADVMRLTQFTTTVAEIRVSYDYQGERLSSSAASNLRIENRNVMTWADDRRAGAFVTPLDPAVLRFSRNVAALVRQQSTVALSKNLQKAVAIFSAMELYGFEYAIDPDSSYAELSEQDEVLDYLQFPTQTLDYHAGDCDDLSILYSALLESEQIPTAFLTIPGHIFVAFDLGLSEEDARVGFAQSESLIYRDGRAWMPVETTVIDRGFAEAWAIGAQQWKQADAAGSADLITIAESQTVYTPVGLPDDSFRPLIPDSERVLDRYQYQLGRIVQRQLEPIIQELEGRIASASSDDSKARLANRLGTIYAQYGRFQEAATQFHTARELGDPNAVFNLGNVAYLEGDVELAVEYYEEALIQRPSNAVLLVSTAKAYFELEDYELAADYFERGRIRTPTSRRPLPISSGKAQQTAVRHRRRTVARSWDGRESNEPDTQWISDAT